MRMTGMEARFTPAVVMADWIETGLPDALHQNEHRSEEDQYQPVILRTRWIRFGLNSRIGKAETSAM